MIFAAGYAPIIHHAASHQAAPALSTTDPSLFLLVLVAAALLWLCPKMIRLAVRVDRRNHQAHVLGPELVADLAAFSRSVKPKIPRLPLVSRGPREKVYHDPSTGQIIPCIICSKERTVDGRFCRAHSE